MSEEITSLKGKTIRGIVWSCVDIIGTKGFNFIINLFIARQLYPSDYGVIAMVAIFMAIFQCFIDSGFSLALVRNLNRTESDYTTVFYFNIIISIITYFIFYAIAPLIASFYKITELTLISRVLALSLILNALSIIQISVLTINIDYRKKAIISLLTILLTGSIGLWMAYNGYGVWSLVVQTISASLIKTILLWLLVRWIPKVHPSWESFKSMAQFGSKVLLAGLFNTIYNNIYTMIIGKCFSPTSLGEYSKADTIAKLPSESIIGVVQSVSFPVLSSIQEDDNRFISTFSLFNRLTFFIVCPMLLGVAAIAEPFILICLTDKWEGAVILLQLLCFACIWWPITSFNASILNIKGYSNYYLKSQVINKFIGILILAITIPFGIKVMCIGLIISSVLSIPITTKYTKKIIGYSIKDNINDLYHIFIHAIVMFLVVLLSMRFCSNVYMKIICGIIIGSTYYLGGARVLKFKEYEDFIFFIKGLTKN